jgi:hypothetical protein
MGDRADHTPYKWAMALRIDPRVKMVGDQGEAKAGLFGQARMTNQIIWGMLFA